MNNDAASYFDLCNHVLFNEIFHRRLPTIRYDVGTFYA